MASAARNERIGLETLKHLPEMIPGGWFQEAEGLRRAQVVYRFWQKSDLDACVSKLKKFETVEFVVNTYRVPAVASGSPDCWQVTVKVKRMSRREALAIVEKLAFAGMDSERSPERAALENEAMDILQEVINNL